MTNFNPGTQEYWDAKSHVFSMVNALKTAHNEICLSSGDFVFCDGNDNHFEEDESSLAEAHRNLVSELAAKYESDVAKWNDLRSSVYDNDLFWTTLWATKEGILFLLIIDCFEDSGIYDQQIKICSSGKLCLDKGCNLNISLSKTGQFILSTHCLWNAEGEEDPLLVGSFPEVLDQAKKIILAKSSVS